MHINYLPNIAYFQYLHLNENPYTLYLNDKYTRQTYRNRTEIAGPNGKMVLSIPTQGLDPENRMFENVKISYAENWQKQHWKSFESAYRRSPYFEFYEEKFRPFYFEQGYEHLWEYNFNLIQLLMKLMKNENTLLLDKQHPFNEQNEYKLRNAVNYQQVFSNKYPFIENLSVIDLIFNRGPQTLQLIV